MGLVGLEVAEIAEPAASESPATTSAAATAATSASAASAKTSTAAAKASSTAAARPTPSRSTSSRSTSRSQSPSRASIAGERLIQFRVLAKLLHVDTREGIGGPRLPGDGDRVGREIGVVG
jgi:hypothetical protein